MRKVPLDGELLKDEKLTLAVRLSHPAECVTEAPDLLRLCAKPYPRIKVGNRNGAFSFIYQIF